MIGQIARMYHFRFKSWHMKPVFKVVALALLILSIVLYVRGMHDGDYHYDRHGYYTGPDGVLHRESEAENNFFLFLLCVALLIVTAVLGFKKSRARIQVK